MAQNFVLLWAGWQWQEWSASPSYCLISHLLGLPGDIPAEFSNPVEPSLLRRKRSCSCSSNYTDRAGEGSRHQAVDITVPKSQAQLDKVAWRSLQITVLEGGAGKWPASGNAAAASRTPDIRGAICQNITFFFSPKTSSSFWERMYVWAIATLSGRKVLVCIS